MTPKDLLDRPMLQLSEVDFLRFRDLIEGGTLITGGLGSGKSSTSGRALALSFLDAGLGGLILTVKSDETEHWIQYAKRTGRSKDLVIFNAENGCFDPLAYSWAAGGRAAGYIETIVELFSTLMSVGKHYNESSGERYFVQAVEELIRSILVLLSLGGDPVSILTIHKIVSSLPSEPAQIEDTSWQESSECGKLISRIRSRKHDFTPSQWDDLEVAIAYALEQWPALDPRTRSNIQSTWSGMGSKFTYDPFRRMFCSGKYSFTPEQTTHERRLILVDVPVLEFGREASRLCQILVKIVFQRAWLRHQYKSGCCNGAFLFQDEFALLMHKNEQHFHMVCRGSGIAPVCITPNILNVASEEFGEQEPGSKTLGFLGLLSVKLFHAQNDVATCEYASRQIGKTYQYLDNFNAGSSGENHTHASFGASRQLLPLVEPIEFTKLVKPDGQNPYSQAICYHSGRTFNATKTNFISTFFSRD